MKILTMRSFVTRPTIHRGMAWLFCLALLLPVAQSAAQWHELSHGVARGAGAADHKQGPILGHCDLCLLGAAVSSGAPPVVSQLVHHPAVGHILPLAAWASVWLAAATRVYLIRAPPPASH